MQSVLDSEHLSEQDAADLAQRSDAVAPMPEPERSYPAELGYTVRVEPDDGRPIEASYTDGTMPADVRGLVRWVQEHSGQTR